MHNFAAVVTFSIFRIGIAYCQGCAPGTAEEINGNWYCSPVKAITYSHFPGSGSYNKVTYMNADTGECLQQKHTYSGSLSPLNEELSLHIRGPTWLKQLAVYVPTSYHGTIGQEVGKKSIFHGRRNSHQHLHQHKREVIKDQNIAFTKGSINNVVSAIIEGELVSWTNVYTTPTTTPTIAQARPEAKFEKTNADSLSNAETRVYSPFPKSNISGTVKQDSSWSREAYYDAAAGVSKGFTFLNHFGGSKDIPGTADGIGFGASLSYASCDGQSRASSPQILSDTMIPDGTEIVIMSDKSCNDGGCGYIRPNSVAYRELRMRRDQYQWLTLLIDGFGGDHKIFLLEFSMPSTGKTGFNGDMPAIWLLNAQIPLTSQYGENPDCSCWNSGCGEFDLFEILDSGNYRCKSTLHMAPAGGCSDYFERPTKGAIKAAVVFTGSKEVAHIQILDSSQRFDMTLATEVVDGFISQAGNGIDSSLFVLSP